MSDDSSDNEPLPVDHAFECGDCGERWYYTKRLCPACRSEAITTYELGEGEVVARTDVAVTPPDVRSPNLLALVRFEGVQLIAQLTEAAEVGATVTFDRAYQLREGVTGQPRLTPV
ncbi:MAG: hypothetical protein U5K28_04215 [Halobacteriales archaeon]|nr:hypothetical protein [Halobacteriales archaeon]